MTFQKVMGAQWWPPSKLMIIVLVASPDRTIATPWLGVVKPRNSGWPRMLEVLGDRLAAADLTTLLLAVLRRRAGRLSAADVMRQYERDRFVAPGLVPFAGLRDVEEALLVALPSEFEMVTLSPLAPLGAHSALATVDQNRVVSTVRSTEVAADPTNALALEAGRRRRDLLQVSARSQTPVRLAATSASYARKRCTVPAWSRIFNSSRSLPLAATAATTHLRRFTRSSTFGTCSVRFSRSARRPWRLRSRRSRFRLAPRLWRSPRLFPRSTAFVSPTRLRLAAATTKTCASRCLPPSVTSARRSATAASSTGLRSSLAATRNDSSLVDSASTASPRSTSRPTDPMRRFDAGVALSQSVDPTTVECSSSRRDNERAAGRPPVCGCWVVSSDRLVYRRDVGLASIRGASSPSRAVWELAIRASTAWSSQDPEGVAACYEEAASLTINDGVPAGGRAALAATAASYMTAFPDLAVSLDDLHVAGDCAFWVWTLTGTNTGPGGTGNAVRVSGIEVWKIGASGLVAESTGHYDAATYEHQLAHGIDA